MGSCPWGPLRSAQRYSAHLLKDGLQARNQLIQPLQRRNRIPFFPKYQIMRLLFSFFVENDANYDSRNK